MNIRLLDKKFRLILAIIAVMLLSAILFACLYSPPASSIVAAGELADALAAEGHSITRVAPDQLAVYSDSKGALMMDGIAAYPLVQVRGGSFTPYYLSTIIIAVDIDQTDASPDSWASLLRCKKKVAMSSLNRNFVEMSVVYALGGEQNALNWFSSLSHDGNLLYLDKAEGTDLFSNAPIALLPDVEAASLIKQGMNIKTIVPSEGAFSVPWGLYEQSSGVALSDISLLRAGLRLPDGQCNFDLYPADYSAAKTINDYSSFGQATDTFHARFQREVRRVRLFSTANGFEHILSYLLLAFGICVWGFSIYMRTADRHLQRILVLQALVLIFWVLLRCLRFLVYGQIFFLWYLYYLPILVSPLLFVYACRIALEDEKQNDLRRINAVLAVVTLLFLVFVLTNDLHQCVFRFTGKTVVNWVDDYNYNFGYLHVMGWVAILIFYGFFMLFRRVRNADSLHMLFAPLIALVIMLAYGFCYIFKVQFANESEMTFIASVFILILWELCIDTGLFQSNTHYTDMFKITKMPVWLLNSELQVKQHSEIAGNFPTNAAKAIMEGMTHFSLSSTEICDAMAIHGGYAVWKTDIANILIFQEQLREKAAEIARQNAILEKETALRKESAVLEQRKNASAMLEKVIADKLSEINKLTETLSSTPDTEDKKTLIRIKLLTGFCKRIGMLVLSGEQNGYVKLETLGLLLSEAAIDIKTAGIDCNVYYTDRGRIKAENAAQIYTFCSKYMLHLAQHSEATVFCRLLPKNEVLTLILIADVAADIDGLKTSDDFSALNITCSCDEDSFIIKAQTGGYIND